MYARVVVDVAPSHLDRPFDYLVPDGVEVTVGQRVRVVFAGRRRTGWVVGTAAESRGDAARVRPLAAVDGERRWFDAEDLTLWRWVADRYAASLADVLRHALPARVAAVEQEAARWDQAPRPPRADRPPCPAASWRPYAASPLLNAVAQAEASRPAAAFWLRVLPGDDRAAMVADLVARCAAAGRSALVLAPDAASGVLDAALSVAGERGADLRVDTQRSRYRAFLRCRGGYARVAVGERGAVFAPLRDLGLVVVEDEANPAYKERRSPRHHAREVALARARLRGATCVLLGDLPSANLWRLLAAGHVERVSADRATERECAPHVEVVDLADPRPGTRRGRFTERAAAAMSAVVRGAGSAVVLAARGGQGSALACRGCRRRLTCPACFGSLAVVGERERRAATAGGPPPQSSSSAGSWRCAACGWTGPAFACPDCGDARHSPLAAGAARLAAELGRSYPAAEVVRMEGFDAPGPRRRPAVAVMTRGSVVTRPGWLAEHRADVLVVPDADAMLRRASFDAAEDALRLWLAAGHWARRIVLQTREPAHHAVQALVRWDPEGFWQREAPRRAELGYPPAAWLLRFATPDAGTAADVAAALRAALPAGDDVLGPDLDHGLIVKSGDLRGTLAGLTPLRHGWDKASRKVRVDVDPLL